MHKANDRLPVKETVYWSVDEFLDKVKGKVIHQGRGFPKALRMAEDGWSEGVQMATPIVKAALETIEQEAMDSQWVRQTNKRGRKVDIGKYRTGNPSCTYRIKPIRVSKVGRVVTLCSSITYSGAVGSDSRVKKGAAVVALAMALQECGHETEVWVDRTIEYHGKVVRVTKVRIKAAQDSVDPSVLAYWLGHPSLLADMFFVESNGETGTPCDPYESLTDGTIYLPTVHSARDVPDADKYVQEKLVELGLVDG